MEDFFNNIICVAQSFMNSLFSLFNSTIGSFLSIELTAPDLGCTEE